MKKGISKNVVWRRVLVFATLLLFVAGALTPVTRAAPPAGADDDWDYWTNSPHVYLNTTGNVGIGTTNPIAKLDVRGDIHLDSMVGTFRIGYPMGDGWKLATSGGGADLHFVDDPSEGGGASRLFLQQGGNVGIGTISPTARLHVYNGPILFSGTTGSTPTSGAGTRLMWIPAKSAFRAGYVSGSQWDDTNIGYYSTAMGLVTTANGTAATAMGCGTVASGPYATAMGDGTISSGFASTAMGYDTTASGNYSTAMGTYTTASGISSTAMGRGITVSGENSVGIGLDSTSYTVSDDNVLSVMGGKLGVGTVSPDANYRMEIQGNPKGLYVKTDDNTYESIVGQCHHQYRPAGFVLENRYPVSGGFPKGVMMRFKGMDTNGVMQEYLAFIAEYVTRTAGAIDGDCWIRPVKNGGANWAFRFTHDGKLLIKDGGSASDVPESALHVVGAINLDPIPAPTSPTTGFIIYCDQADGDLKAKSDTGIVTTIASD